MTAAFSIRVERSGNKAVTTVGNTGPTIAPEELPLIFDRFHKTDKSRSTDGDGVGLGLYIVKTIVLAHGEDIYVTSRDGKTEFTFTPAAGPLTGETKPRKEGRVVDKMTPMDPEYQETPPEWQPGTPGYYGTGRLPKPPRSHTGLIVVLLCVMIVANVITVLMLLTLRMRAVQKNTTVGAGDGDRRHADADCALRPQRRADGAAHERHGHAADQRRGHADALRRRDLHGDAAEPCAGVRGRKRRHGHRHDGGRLPYHERAHRFRRGEHHSAAQRWHGVCGGPVRHGREQ